MDHALHEMTRAKRLFGELHVQDTGNLFMQPMYVRSINTQGIPHQRFSCCRHLLSSLFVTVVSLFSTEEYRTKWVDGRVVFGKTNGRKEKRQDDNFDRNK